MLCYVIKYIPVKDIIIIIHMKYVSQIPSYIILHNLTFQRHLKYVYLYYYCRQHEQSLYLFTCFSGVSLKISNFPFCK